MRSCGRASPRLTRSRYADSQSSLATRPATTRWSSSPEDFVGDTLALRNGSAFFPTFKAGFTYRFTSQVDVPTTIAWATRDQVLVYGQSGLAQERLPNARHVALTHCGHVPMIDDPDLIVRVIENTIDEAAGSEEQAA